jgi:DNA repair photolyase
MTVRVREIQAKSILRKSKKIDSWFISCYGMNLYRGCAHNCVYCDGRAEKYNVDGEFGRDVAVKINAVEILKRELDPRRRRIPLKKCFMLLGGGVCDAYQPLENKYEVTRKTLELFLKLNYPVHILTKSTLIKRDADIIEKINESTRALVSMSFSTVDEKISSIFEPNIPAPQERLDALAYFKNRGIACGMFYMPVIPLISDSPAQMEQVLSKAAGLGLDYVVFSGMTLKPGRQSDYFLNVLRRYYPQHEAAYRRLYPGSKWGSARSDYYYRINKQFYNVAVKYRIQPRIPLQLFNTILKQKELVIVVLEHLDYLLRLQGKPSSYGYTAYIISKSKNSLAEILERGALKNIRGYGELTENLIRKLMTTKKCGHLASLLNSSQS